MPVPVTPAAPVAVIGGAAPGVGQPTGAMPPGPYHPTQLPPGYVIPVLAGPAQARPHGLAIAGIGARLVARLVDIVAVLILVAIANAWLAREWWQHAFDVDQPGDQPGA